MSDRAPPDDDLPPIADLASFRAGRASRRAGVESAGKLEAEVEDGTLWLSLRNMRWRVGLKRAHVDWLRAWLLKFEQAERELVAGPARHRCHTCSRVKWIECRGHRAWGETRTHYAVKVLERGGSWVSHAGHPGTSAWVPSIRQALTSCKRITGDASESWETVDCANCLRRKPKAVP